MKVWKDANEVIKMIHELPSELKNIDREMSKKPNFEHHEKKCKAYGCNNHTRTESRLCAQHIDRLIYK